MKQEQFKEINCFLVTSLGIWEASSTNIFGVCYRYRDLGWMFSARLYDPCCNILFLRDPSSLKWLQSYLLVRLKKTEVVRHLSRKYPFTSEFASYICLVPVNIALIYTCLGYVSFLSWSNLPKLIELLTIDIKMLKNRSRQRTRDPQAAL